MERPGSSVSEDGSSEDVSGNAPSNISLVTRALLRAVEQLRDIDSASGSNTEEQDDANVNLCRSDKLCSATQTVLISHSQPDSQKAATAPKRSNSYPKWNLLA
jgi:hypothetical protein